MLCQPCAGPFTNNSLLFPPSSALSACLPSFFPPFHPILCLHQTFFLFVSFSLCLRLVLLAFSHSLPASLSELCVPVLPSLYFSSYAFLLTCPFSKVCPFLCIPECVLSHFCISVSLFLCLSVPLLTCLFPPLSVSVMPPPLLFLPFTPHCVAPKRLSAARSVNLVSQQASYASERDQDQHRKEGRQARRQAPGKVCPGKIGKGKNNLL